MNTNFFSYHSPEITVSKDMCDYNGHMNVTYYYKLFDSVYSSFYIEKLGFDNEYLKSGFSTFTLEDSIRYLNEFTLGELVYPSFTLYKANKKLLHFVGILQNADSDLAAIFETVLAHIDLNKRKVVNFSDEKIKHLQNVYLVQRKMIDIPFEIKLHIKDIDE
jgi:acyl-CoA thioester hydrolase